MVGHYWDTLYVERLNFTGLPPSNEAVIDGQVQVRGGTGVCGPHHCGEGEAKSALLHLMLYFTTTSQNLRPE